MGNFDYVMKNLTREGEWMLLQFLHRIGEEAVKMARLKHENDWTDQTGNLRSSINYGVYKNGVAVDMGKPEIYKEGAEGAQKARELLSELGSKSQNEYTLIIVAGMNYASFVENIYHKDVISGAAMKAEELAEKLIKGL